MSIVDAARFAKDVATDKELVARIKDKVSGLPSLVELGKANGYSFTLDELRQVVRSPAGRDLTEDQLNAFVGAKSTSVQESTNALGPAPALMGAMVQAMGSSAG